MSDWDRQTTPGGVEGPQWVSAAEAADVAGVTPGTVRYWARNGLIVSEVVEGPAGEKTLVRLDEVLQHARQEAPSRPAPPGPRVGPPPAPGAAGGDVVTDLPARTSELAPILKSIPEIMAQLTSATDRAARAETKVEFLSAQVTELRRRLAEVEAGAATDGTPSAVMPEAWEQSEPLAATIAEETPDPAPEVTGWPAPPADALQDVPAAEASPDLRSVPPAEAAEPGPEIVDWTTRDPSAGPEDAPAAEEVAVDETPALSAPADDAGDLSLDDIWNQPAAPGPAPLDEAPEPAPSEVAWHEPAGRAPAPPPPPRAANAPVPEGDDFYGPRRRRWFKRRR
ncbi:MAG TPA: hypothetical protein VEV43_10565 [Actinomycetota bacterium]|nr:hypothetical protein [Actinomycetota bacterium]